MTKKPALLLCALLLAAWGVSRAAAQAPENLLPDIEIGVNQAFFETPAVLEEQQAVLHEIHWLADYLHDISIQFKDDGVHASGKYGLLNIGVDTFLDITRAGPRAFDVRVRKFKISVFALRFDAKIAAHFFLKLFKARIAKALPGVSGLELKGGWSDDVQILRVTLDMARFVPALPQLELAAIDTRDRELLFKLTDPGIR